MSKYLHRSSPKYGDYVGVVSEPPEPVKEISIDAKCMRYGYRLGLQLILSQLPKIRTLSYLYFK
jgi:hypothetical protein